MEPSIGVPLNRDPPIYWSILIYGSIQMAVSLYLVRHIGVQLSDSVQSFLMSVWRYGSCAGEPFSGNAFACLFRPGLDHVQTYPNLVVMFASMSVNTQMSNHSCYLNPYPFWSKQACIYSTVILVLVGLGDCFQTVLLLCYFNGKP